MPKATQILADQFFLGWLEFLFKGLLDRLTNLVCVLYDDFECWTKSRNEPHKVLTKLKWLQDGSLL